ncbi:MAG: permease-like cell division protein FtsX [Corynebacterium sp.]|nr:permease-like cell division protein FtsX [Corynebacterium sp.]
MNYVIREAFKGLGHNITMTIALVITSAISLALLGTGFLVTEMTSNTKEIYLDRVEVLVQLDDETSSTDTTCSSDACEEVQKLLESQSDITQVTYRNRDQAYERFVELFQDSDPLLVRETSKDALPAEFRVRLKDPLDTASLDAVRELPQVASVIDQVDDLRRATDNLDSIRNATFLVSAIQAIASIFLIANMVQIAAFSRRHEMSIMRMVGASRWFTQAPFIIESVIGTLVGAVFAIGGLFAAKTFVVDKALRSLYDAHLVANIRAADIWVISPVLLLVGAIFAVATASVTLAFYVRK